MNISSITSGMNIGGAMNIGGGDSDMSTTSLNNLGISTDFNKLLEDIKSGTEQPKDAANSQIKLKSLGTDFGALRVNNSGGFSAFIKELVNDVNDMQIDAGDKTDKFIKGDPIDIHEVMIASNKAKTSFQLLLELRNKGLDLYREVSRMQ